MCAPPSFFAYYSILCYNKRSSRPIFYKPQCGRPQKKKDVGL